MIRISLREYLEAKNALVQAYLTNPTTSQMYRVLKYGKIPVALVNKQHQISLRPNDLVETISLPKDGINTIIKMRFVCSHNMTIIDDKFQPVWKQDKLRRWLSKSCTEVTSDEAEDLDNFM